MLIAGYTYENTRLLLVSKSAAYPNGLSNNHGQVGRHYFIQAQNLSVAALFPYDLNVWYGTPGQGVNIDNWADDNFDHAGLDFIGGGTLWAFMERRPISAVNAVQGFMRGLRRNVHGVATVEDVRPPADRPVDLPGQDIQRLGVSLVVMRRRAEAREPEALDHAQSSLALRAGQHEFHVFDVRFLEAAALPAEGKDGNALDW